jgi:uncharacterized protein YvpB
MTKILEKVPHFSQLDNLHHPYGSCNVTSIAMCLWYYGIRGNGSQKQLEDQLYQDLLNAGKSRHDPYDLQWLVNRYSPTVTDKFTPFGTMNDIKSNIDSEHPVVLHGYFTRSGHIIAVVGYNDYGLIVNDPYGEYYDTGYDTRANGKGLLYSYGLIAAICSPESVSAPRDLYVHLFCKK